MKKPSDFKIGQVYQMAVASRSHVTKPYYVIIKNVGPGFIETEIPGKHSAIINSDNWDYHIPRMKFIGSGSDAEKLLYNQKGLAPDPKKYLVGIPCLYGADHTRKAIESVVNNLNTDVLLIDNGAEKEVKELINSYSGLSNVTVIHNHINIFVNPAWNQILNHFLTHSQYDYLLIMNSDLVIRRNWNKILDLYFEDLPNAIPLPVMEEKLENINREVELEIKFKVVSNGTPGVLIVLNRKHAEIVYPLPDYIKIWFGDNWIFETLRSLGYITIIAENFLSYHSWSQNVSKLSGAHEIIEQDKIQWALNGKKDIDRLLDKVKKLKYI